METQTSKHRALRKECSDKISQYLKEKGETEITNLKVNGWYENIMLFQVGDGFRLKTDIGNIIQHEDLDTTLLCLISDMLNYGATTQF